MSRTISRRKLKTFKNDHFSKNNQGVSLPIYIEQKFFHRIHVDHGSYVLEHNFLNGSQLLECSKVGSEALWSGFCMKMTKFGIPTFMVHDAWT